MASKPQPSERGMSWRPVIGEKAVITFTVPLVPPSVNHYVKHTKTGGHYRTRAADAFMEGIWVHSGRRKMRAKAYSVEAVIYLGKGQKGDTDNFAKVIGDGLAKAGVIHSDAAITDWVLRKRRDRKEPRTVITVIGL